MGFFGYNFGFNRRGNGAPASGGASVTYALKVRAVDQSDISAGSYNTLSDAGTGGYTFTAAGTKCTKDSTNTDGGVDTIATNGTAQNYDSGESETLQGVLGSSGMIIARVRPHAWSNFFGEADPILGTYNVSGHPIICLKLTSATNMRFTKFSSGTLYAANVTVAMDTWYTLIMRWDNDTVHLQIKGSADVVQTDVNRPINGTSVRLRLFKDVESGGHYNGNVNILAAVDGDITDETRDAMLADLGL